MHQNQCISVLEFVSDDSKNNVFREKTIKVSSKRKLTYNCWFQLHKVKILLHFQCPMHLFLFLPETNSCYSNLSLIIFLLMYEYEMLILFPRLLPAVSDNFTYMPDLISNREGLPSAVARSDQ